LEDGESVEVLSGLKGGERVVVGATDALTDGQRVAVAGPSR
jgi:multidrug efflux pump subunit AcrA (membrane-fusion protein)